MTIPLVQLQIFFFILARIAGVFLQAPILSSRSFPFPARVAFAVWLAFTLWFVTPVATPLPATFVGFMVCLLAEAAFGFLIGFITNVIFLSVQAAGEIMDVQMGLSVATTLDPIFGSVISIIGRLSFYLAMIIFLLFNGHHLILSALHQSFTVIPAGKIINFASPGLVLQIMSLGTALWLTAIKLSAPILLLIFLADFSFGIVSRVAPQVNVFQLGFQVKPMLGLFGIMMILPFVIKYIGQLLEFMGQQLVLLFSVVK